MRIVSALLALLAASALAGDARVGRVVVGPDNREDLIEHVANQLTSRTNGKTGDFTGTANLAHYYVDMPTNHPNFWLWDVTNILACARFRAEPANDGTGRRWKLISYATGISPRFCVTQSHQNSFLENDQSHKVYVWLLPDGTYYTNTVIAERLYADFRIWLMEKTNAVWAKAAKADRNLYRQFMGLGGKWLTIVANHGACWGNTNPFASTVTFAANNSIEYFYAGMDPAYCVRFGDEQPNLGYNGSWSSGDSGSPTYLIVRNEAHLIGVANSVGVSASIGANAAEINRVMREMCETNGVPVEQITYSDCWSNFRRYNQ